MCFAGCQALRTQEDRLRRDEQRPRAGRGEERFPTVSTYDTQCQFLQALEIGQTLNLLTGRCRRFSKPGAS